MPVDQANISKELIRLEMPSLSRPYFSPVRGREKTWLAACWFVTAVSTLILIFAWQQTRSLDTVVYFFQWRSIAPVDYFFRAFVISLT